MMKIAAVIIGLLIMGTSAIAQDVSIDENGNVTTGSSNPMGSGNLDVTGASGEHAIRGVTSGTGAVGVYGENNDVSGYGGYFQGNARVTGNLTVDGTFNTAAPVTFSGNVLGGAPLSGINYEDFGYGVYGQGSGSAAPYGGYFTANSNGGIGVSGRATGNNSKGVYGLGENGATAGYFQSATGYGLIVNSGNVGIGTTSPNEQLEITRNFRLPATTATTGIIKQGSDTLIHTYGTANFFAGINAGNLTTTGNNNTASGYSALSNNTTANYNTAVGSHALNLQSYDNAGTAWASHNTAVGYKALESNQPTNTVNGINNTAIGSQALNANTTGIYNTASGYNALYSNTTGSNNTASGSYALYANTTGHSNIASGVFALTSNTTGIYNTASGYSALSNNTTGDKNTALGYDADVSSGALTNATAIGYTATVNASNKVRIGNSSVTVIEGQVGWSYPSDIRIKKEVEEIEYGLDFVKQLRPVQYKLQEGNERTDFGFIAQDIEALLGTEYNVLSIGEDEESRLSLRYTDLIAPMVKAMQEQQEQIEAQMEIIDRQQEQIDELKAIMEELTTRL